MYRRFVQSSGTVCFLGFWLTCVFRWPLECRELLVGINLFLAIHFSPSIFAVDIAQIHFGTVIARAAQVSLKGTDYFFKYALASKCIFIKTEIGKNVGLS